MWSHTHTHSKESSTHEEVKIVLDVLEEPSHHCRQVNHMSGAVLLKDHSCLCDVTVRNTSGREVCQAHRHGHIFIIALSVQ